MTEENYRFTVHRFDGLECTLSDWLPNGYPRHFHLAAEGLLMVDGASTLVTPAGEATVRAGDMAVVYAFEPHSGLRLSAEPTRFFSVLFDRPLRLPSANLSGRVIRDNPGLQRIRRMLQRETPAAALLESAAVAAVGLAEERLRAADASHAGDAALKDWLKAAWLRFSQPGCDDRSIGAVAADLGVSAPHLSSAFAAQFGISPQQFIIARRIEQSRAALSDGQSLAEIAAQHGFADQSHYSRLFRKHYCLAPGAFRRRVSVAPAHGGAPAVI